jgi:hypothetical protein
VSETQNEGDKAMDEDAIMQILKSIQETQAKHTIALTKLEERAVNNSIAFGVQQKTLNALHQDVRMVRAALNDMERTRFSAGEAAALHEDVGRLQALHTDLAVRVGVLEVRAE